MKRNIGIGRRLAPLVDNDRRVAELLHALLFSFPGSPVLYYGDEIGMGDNIYLGDRDGVRTPMQWSPDRNAGFSRADFAQLYLPPLMDPVYGYQAVNVEAQMRNPSSLLHWMRRMLEVRKQHPVFGTGQLRGDLGGEPVGAGLRPHLPADGPEIGTVTARRRRRVGTADPTSCCASATCPASPSPPSCRCSGGRARRRSSCSAGCRFPGSASCPTSSPWPRTASTGSSWSTAPVIGRRRDDRPARPGVGRTLHPAYLGRQRWYAGAAEPPADDGAGRARPELWVGRRRAPPAVARPRRRRTATRYQLLIGERPGGERGGLPARPRGGGARRRSSTAYFYDAILDPEMARVLLEVASDGAETATLARPSPPSSPTPRSSSTTG